MKKLISFILVFVLTFLLCGCSTGNTSSKISQTSNEDKNYRDNMTLLYSAADTFNPYTAKTEINRQLCKLLYEPLVKTDNEFNSVYSIAQSVEVAKNICTVKLKNVKFSDGTRLTSNDVVYSYNLVVNSNTSYKYKLYNVKAVVVSDENTVVFELNKQDPYFEKVLDFPIIKSESDKNQDSDSVKKPPIGCGRYKVNETEDMLLQNENYFGKKGSIQKINLINSPDTESISHYIEIGAVDMYFSDISDGTIMRMSGTKSDVNLNNLVYIGVNHSDGRLMLSGLRQAMSSGIDRQKICKDAFYNNALAATGFFNPVWEVTKSLQNIQITANPQITVENLQEIGYNELDAEGYRRKGGSVLSFSLLVNSNNQMRVAAANIIAEQLKAYGIKITVVKASYEEYINRLKSGNFQLYLGEVKITENMDLSNLVCYGGTAAYGIPTQAPLQETQDGEIIIPSAENLACSQVINGFYKGENSINDVAVTLQNDMPIIPLCYRTGVLLCNENIENVSNSSISDIYFSIESYKIKKD